MEANEMKQTRGRSRRKKPASFLAIMCVAVLCMGTMATMIAYLAAGSNKVINTFTPGKVTPEIKEDYEDGLKSNVYIQNTANVRAYIRVAVIADNLKEEFVKDGEGKDTDVISTDIIGDFLHTDVDDKGNPTTHPIEDYLDTRAGKWILHKGYYYWTEPIEPSEYTGDLLRIPIPIYKVCEEKEGQTVTSRKVVYNHQVTVLAEAIQSDGVTEEGMAPCEYAWKVTISEGQVVDYPPAAGGN